MFQFVEALGFTLGLGNLDIQNIEITFIDVSKQPTSIFIKVSVLMQLPVLYLPKPSAELQLSWKNDKDLLEVSRGPP